MDMILKNWMTSLPGFILLARVLWETWQTKTLNWDNFQEALVSVGLIFAKDFNVVGGTKRQ